MEHVTFHLYALYVTSGKKNNILVDNLLERSDKIMFILYEM